MLDQLWELDWLDIIIPIPFHFSFILLEKIFGERTILLNILQVPDVLLGLGFGVTSLLCWVVNLLLNLLEVEDCVSDSSWFFLSGGRLLLEEEHVFSINSEYAVECRDCLLLPQYAELYGVADLEAVEET